MLLGVLGWGWRGWGGGRFEGGNVCIGLLCMVYSDLAMFDMLVSLTVRD